MTIEIRKIKVAEVWACENWPKLLEEYTKECKFKEFPDVEINKELYNNLEKLGTLQAFGAFKNNDLIGFIIVMSYPSTHYDLTMATTEGFMVLQEHRCTGAGLKLLRAVEKHVQTYKAGALFVSAPIGQKLAKVMKCTKYKEAAKLYFKRFVYEVPS